MIRTLLLCGIFAGPLYILVAGVQAFTRDGFEVTRHPASLLSNGDLGWIQVFNFVITGVLVVGASFGLRAIAASGGIPRSVPILLTVFGISLIASGVFVADPADGFPPGTPAGAADDVSLSGVLHFMSGGIGFLAFIAACLVSARAFLTGNDRVMAAFSVITGFYYLAAFGFIATGGGSSLSIVMFTFAVVLGSVWVSFLFVTAYAESRRHAHRSGPAWAA